MEADITDRAQAEAAVQQAAGRFGRLDILVNNAGLMLLGPIAGADPEEWDRMIAINVQGLLYTTRALPHLLQAAQQSPRRVADIVNISSIAGRVAWNGYGVYSFTKFAAIETFLNRDELGQSGNATGVVGMVMAENEVVDPGEFRLLGDGEDALGVALLPASVDQQRFTRRRNDQSGCAALDIDPIDIEVTRLSASADCEHK